MRIALDTNRYTDLCRGESSVAEIVATADAVFLPFVVVGELLGRLILFRTSLPL